MVAPLTWAIWVLLRRGTMTAMTENSGSRKSWRHSSWLVASLVFVGVGLLLAARPFIAQMAPNPATPAPETIDVEIGDIGPGDHVTISWRGLPVIIMRRTNAEMAASRAVPLDILVDRFSRNEALSAEAPATDTNRILAAAPQWLVLIGVNPHSGCRLKVLDLNARFNDETFLCPCDGSRFDALGRIRSGPARTNLRVPVYKLVNPQRMRIG